MKSVPVHSLGRQVGWFKLEGAVYSGSMDHVSSTEYSSVWHEATSGQLSGVNFRGSAYTLSEGWSGDSEASTFAHGVSFASHYRT